jgi:integrase
MRGRQAKVLSDTELKRLIKVAKASRHPLRNTVIVLLSAKAGLRAGEIASLQWSMLIDASGKVGRLIELPGLVTKYGLGRRMPLHFDLRRALITLGRQNGLSGPVIASERKPETGQSPCHMSAKAVVNWFADAFDAAGLEDCSSHSGRRTFVTRAARLVHKAGGSLRDVQQLAGHRSIETTQGYIDGDRDAQRRLVRLI